MNAFISSLQAKKRFNTVHDKAIRFLYGRRRPHIQHKFPTKNIEIAND
jgi:hypothetical protein